MILKTLWDVENIMGWVNPPLHVWTDTQSENITSRHPSDAGGKKVVLLRQLRVAYIYPLGLSTGKDNFVRCPREALTWEYRRLKIIEEVLAISPDIACFQVNMINTNLLLGTLAYFVFIENIFNLYTI